MDLAIATVQFAAVIDVRSADAEGCGSERRSDATRSQRISRSVSQADVGLGAGDGFAQVDVRRASLGQRHCGRADVPDADAVTVGRQPLVALRTGTTRFAMIFDVHAEDHTSANAASIGHGVIANTREAHLVGWGAAR